MPKPEKVAAVAGMAESFRSSSAAVLTDYRGLTMAELTELRRSLGEQTSYEVVKNTLAKLAVGDAGLAAVSELLVGPTAVAFVTGDPVEAAKCLRDFARAHPLLVIKGGVMEGRALSADEVRRLADLQSREVLLAMLAGAMQASLAQAAGLFAAPLAQAARVLAALRDQLPAGTDATPEASADAPAEAEAPAEPEASADAPAEPEASADAPAEVDAPAEPEASAEPDTTDVEPTPAAE